MAGASITKVASPHDLEPLVRASNAHARETYQQAFDALSPADLERLDLLVARTPEQRIPTLKNGTNRYLETASAPLSFDFRRFVACGLTPDVFVVVPESPNLLAPYITPSPRSCLSDLAASPLRPGWLTIADCGNIAVDSCVRAFDSHLSVLFYWRTVLDMIRRLGGSVEIDGVEVAFRPYKCDLAGRFSEATATSLFVHNRHFHSEMGGDSQSGRTRLFRNPGAPNKQAVALIGDSHSFSAMSQLLSYYYESVTFYWANRASDYGNCADAIKRAHADIVIEESSERFLLSNFRVSGSA